MGSVLISLGLVDAGGVHGNIFSEPDSRLAAFTFGRSARRTGDFDDYPMMVTTQRIIGTRALVFGSLVSSWRRYVSY